MMALGTTETTTGMKISVWRNPFPTMRARLMIRAMHRAMKSVNTSVRAANRSEFFREIRKSGLESRST